MIRVQLKHDRDRSVHRRHPWVFSGAVDRVLGNPEPGDIVRVVDARNQFLAWGYYNPCSQIRVRLLESSESLRVDADWWEQHLQRAIQARMDSPDYGSTSALRLVYGEADLLPGLIVDRYEDFVVVQSLTAGIEKVKHLLVDLLMSLVHPSGIYERSDVRARSLEGLEPVAGALRGREPSGVLEIRENGYTFLVDVKGGHKTGFYLDQRRNRPSVARYATGRDVLDCFTYTGAFSVYAMGAGARSVIRMDVSPQALSLSDRNMERNGYPSPPGHAVEGDAFHLLRRYRDENRSFGMVILDPPKFAHSRAHLDRAARGYKDINLLAVKLLHPGGILATFSCSGNMPAEFFRKTVSAASMDAGRHLQILEPLSQSNDHPVLISFPESEYLKGMICRVL